MISLRKLNHLHVSSNNSIFKQCFGAVYPKVFSLLTFCATLLSGVCNKMLDSTTCAEHDGKVYCKNCHGKKFGPKGYGFGGGAGALSTETGAQFGNTDSEMT